MEKSGTKLLTSIHFSNNLKKLNEETIKWAHKNKDREEQDHDKLEESLQAIYELEGWGFLTNDSTNILYQIEKKRKKILVSREEFQTKIIG